MSLEFLQPKTHEFRFKNNDETWSETWWTCGTEFAKKLRDRPDLAEVREMEKNDERYSNP